MANKHYHQDYAIWPLPFFYWHKNASKEVLCLLRAILPVSSVSFARKNNSEGAPYDGGMTAPLGKTVPVIVLMAMNPALLNSAATMSNLQGEEENPNLITMAEPAQNFEIDDATYVMQPETIGKSQSVNKPPYGWNLFLQDDIVEVNKGHNALGNFDMVYTNNRIDESGSISDVYIIQKSRNIPAKSAFHPPRVYKLMYHNIGRDKEFCGVITKEDLLDEGGNYLGSLETEIKLDDDTAQKLIDLITGHSNWKNNTGIRIYETTSDMLKPGKRY